MNKKVIRIVSIILIIIFAICIINSPVLAKSGDDIINDGKGWINKGASANPISADQIAKILNPVANILLTIGSVLIVIVAVVMGIKYLTASPDEQGKLKKQLVGVFVSAVVLYGSYGIWSIVYQVLKSTLG